MKILFTIVICLVCASKHTFMTAQDKSDLKKEIAGDLNDSLRRVVNHIDERINEATRQIEEKMSKKIHTEALLLSQLKSELNMQAELLNSGQVKQCDRGANGGNGDDGPSIRKGAKNATLINTGSSDKTGVIIAPPANYSAKPHRVNTDTGIDCATLKNAGHNENGVYVMNLTRPQRILKEVYCDMATDGGGWTVVQRRLNGIVDFNLDWQSYKLGFGYMLMEFWMGNEALHVLTTSRPHTMRIDLLDDKGSARYAQYTSFVVASENDGYKLGLWGYTGNAGNAMISHNLNGQRFSTKDRDNDKHGKNCATDYGVGGWWSDSCTYAPLNRVNYQGMQWYTGSTAMKVVHSEMKIRPRAFKP